MINQKTNPRRETPPRPAWYPDDSWAFAYHLDQADDSGYSLDDEAEYLYLTFHWDEYFNDNPDPAG